MKPVLRSALLCLAAFSLASCTIGYERKWKEAAASADTKNRNGLAGAWEGRWDNEQGGHKGKLWAIATPSKPDHYIFRYKATWGGVFSGVFTAEHEAKRGKAADTFTLGGSKDLGALGGKITFTGTATPSQFHAHYHSKANTGEFVLKRPEQP
jgi:hypothetical protein